MDEELQQNIEQANQDADLGQLDNEANTAGDQVPGDGEPSGDADKPFDPLARLTAAVDSITEATPEGDAAGKPAADLAKPGEKPAAAATDPAAPGANTPEQPAADPDEAELLAGIKSERGKERIRSILGERKQLKNDLAEIQNLVLSTGMKPDEFAQSLEFGRLVNSGNEADLRVALEMLEGTRAQLYASLGVEAPGVDLLAEHADLKEAVMGYSCGGCGWGVMGQAMAGMGMAGAPGAATGMAGMAGALGMNCSGSRRSSKRLRVSLSRLMNGSASMAAALA